ncbi:MAG: cation diffusion facilitator family transporter, partial [Vicinamibacterales bacterium]
MLAIAMALTGGFFIAEVAGGILTGSLALLADAGHMLTDVGGLALAWFATRFASRPATSEHTYGFYRAEILAAVANALVLLGISAFILYEAYERLLDPPTLATWPMLAIAIVGLLVNIVGIKVLAPGADESLNVKGAYFEVLSDLVSSVGVIVAALVMWTTGWRYADPLVSAGIGLFIVPRTWALLRQAIGILLEGTP